MSDGNKRCKLSDSGWDTVRRIIEVIKLPDRYETHCRCSVGRKFRADHAPGCPFGTEMVLDLNACAAAVGLLQDDAEPWKAVLFMLSAAGVLEKINA